MDVFFENLDKIAKETKVKCKTFESFCMAMELNGYIISYPETFKRVYWDEKQEVKNE